MRAIAIGRKNTLFAGAADDQRRYCTPFNVLDGAVLGQNVSRHR
jgi:hypothetical protein